MNPLEDRDERCPWCGAPIEIRIDVSAGPQTYVEDCPVCCAPMLVDVAMDPGSGDGLLVTLEREGD